MKTGLGIDEDFSLKDVNEVIYGNRYHGSGLKACFRDAPAIGTFLHTSRNKLSDFRGYRKNVKITLNTNSLSSPYPYSTTFSLLVTVTPRMPFTHIIGDSWVTGVDHVGEGYISFRVASNPTGRQRQVDIVVKAGGAEATCTYTQAG